MERIFESKDNFLQDLVSAIKQPKKVSAQNYEPEKLSPQETASDHAKNYWWMGYNWDEIEAVLQDMEYPDSVIEKALEDARKYAKETLKGPFKNIKEGQYIKLQGNQIGVVDCVNPKSLSAFLDDNSLVQVDKGMVDWKSTKKLSESFALRLSAAEMNKEAQKYMVPSRPEEFIPETVIPEESGEFETKVKTTPGAPSGFGEYIHVKDVQEVSSTVEKMLGQIEVAQSKLEKVQEELNIANQMAHEIRSKKKELLKEQREVAQDIFAVIGSQNKALEELEGTFFQKYKNKLIGLRRKVVEEAEMPGVFEELTILKAILEVNHPRIFKAVISTLDSYMEANSTIQENVEKTFVMFEPRKKKVSQLWERIKNWASGLWKKIRGISDKLNDETFPLVEESIDAIDSFEASTDVKSAEMKANKLVACLRK